MKDVLHEEWYNIPLTLFRMYMSLFQERYKLYYKQMLTQQSMNKEVTD